MAVVPFVPSGPFSTTVATAAVVLGFPALGYLGFVRSPTELQTDIEEDKLTIEDFVEDGPGVTVDANATTGCSAEISLMNVPSEKSRRKAQRTHCRAGTDLGPPPAEFGE